MGTNLAEVDLQDAKISGCIFTDVDLSIVQGLETIQHLGPSSIGIDTIYRSSGQIPAAFLRGCGVPDSLIDYIPVLVGALEPIQYYSCFISYSSQNEEFARRLHGRMQQAGLHVWFAPEDLKGGRPLEEQIHQAIHVYDKLLLVLSESSLPAKWVISELRKGRQAELAQNRRKLFPIRLVDMRVIDAWECYDRESESDLATEVRAYYIPDFSQWKDHDTFEAAFAKLLAALKAVDEPPVRRDLAPLIARKRRELRVLKLQQATTGIHTLPHVVIAMEDLRKEIAALEQAQAKSAENESQP